MMTTNVKNYRTEEKVGRPKERHTNEALTSDELHRLVGQGEGQEVEFKSEQVKPAALAETLVSLANASGGLVLIGVADDGAIVGVKDLKEALDWVHIAAGRECCDPPVPLIGVDTVAADAGRRVVVARIGASEAVHSANGRYLRRRGSRDIALSGSELRELLLAGRDLTPKRAPGLFLPDGPAGLFEILDYDATLELRDSEGHEALLRRTQTVRFLQDGVVAFYDHAWGDGRILVGYRVRPGVVADRYRVGQRYTTVISLRETRNAGDVVTFQFRRRILDGFLLEEEWLETEVEHRMKRLTVTVLFPRERPYKRAWVVERRRNRMLPLDADGARHRASGLRLVWITEEPRVGESYILRWRW